MNELALARPSDLLDIARRAMIEHGFEPDHPPEALQELEAINVRAGRDAQSLPDLRGLLWASIDNDESRDLDQLTVAESDRNGTVRIRVAIADVDTMVERESAIDRRAEQNTTSVYTAAAVFPMLPERLSTDLTSLNEGEDRSAMVVELVVDGEGEIVEEDVYRALVRNHAKLTYAGVAAWLEDEAPMPDAMARLKGIDEQIRIQDEVARRLGARREEQGALDLRTSQARPVFSGGAIVDFEQEQKSRSRALIENFMIAANGAVARFLRERRLPVLRRIVRSPERWDRIVKLAAEAGEELPPQPDSRALQAFLGRQRTADPRAFGDLSLSVVKLIGSGAYEVEQPGQDPGGHFGLAVRAYTHATAPNRRYPDLITQRLVKTALAGRSSPYGHDELEALARHCTEKEDDAKKVERQVDKAAAAMLLSRRTGQTFDAIVTGSKPKGTWVRILRPTIEGKLVEGEAGLDVGDRLRVKLVATDVERGHIDFARAAD